MTTTRPTTPQSTAPSGSAPGDTTGQAADTARRAKDSAAHEAEQVGREARDQVRNLWSQTRDELTSQAGTQQDRVTSGLRDLSDQLRSMASSGEDSPARDLVEDVARRAGSAASWLEDREPGAIADEVRDFARRRPGAFLAVAAGLGLVAGRLSRGIADQTGTASGTDGSRGARESGSGQSEGDGAATTSPADVDAGPALTAPTTSAQPGVGATHPAPAGSATWSSAAGAAGVGSHTGDADDDVVARGDR